MKNIVLFLSVLIWIGCASKSVENTPLSQEDKRISRLISSTNSNIWGEYGSKNKKDFSKFDQSKYEELLAKGKSRTAEDMRVIFKMFEVKEFTTYPKTFVFCGYSSKLKIAFCDDAACEGTEEIMITTNSKITSELQRKIEIPGVCRGK